MDGFFKDGDPFLHECVYPLTTFEWWSRIYEYRFVADRVGKTDILLDGCAGIGHPFKVFMVEKCRKVYAFDVSPLTKETIEQDRKNWFPNEKPYDERLVEQIDLRQLNAVNINYEDSFFDKACCISVLEHVDTYTKEEAMKEFYRCLKKGGKLLITVDYPDVNIEEIYQIADMCGFSYKRGKDSEPPSGAIKSVYHGGIYCYHFELTK